nr:unnamed protein product [Callosobruchus chinensis]
MCLETLVDLKQGDKKVILLWVPSHRQIRGNELADEAAKVATLSQNIDVKTVKTSETLCNPMEFKSQLNRRDTVKLHRLRMGHTILTHSYLLHRSQPPLCPSCNVALTISHIIGHCPALTNLRHCHELSDNWIHNLNGPLRIKNTLLFLRCTGFYYKI